LGDDSGFTRWQISPNMWKGFLSRLSAGVGSMRRWGLKDVLHRNGWPL